MSERLQVVDENDQPTGACTREEAWAKGLILRKVAVILRDDAGNFLLQQRSLSKKSAPGLWTLTATGGVDENEEYDAAANRELFEEVGVKTQLTSIGKIRITNQAPHGIDDTFTTVYTGTIEHNTPIAVDHTEVETTDWYTPQELANAIATDTGHFSPKMLAIYREFFS